MKRLWILPVMTVVLLLSVNTTRGQDDGELAFELANLREAWLYGDAKTAAARLDTLREDNRLGGLLPRWYAFMRAWLALEEGDEAKAQQVLQPVLEESRDARNYVRVCRLMMTHERLEAAEEVIDQGLKRAPESPALLRFKAGLQWMRGNHDAAMETYLELLCLDERQGYPWVEPREHSWSSATPWPDPEAEDDPGKEEPGELKEIPNGNGKESEEDEETPEPHISLFTPARWYTTDLPGLARCIDGLAANGEAVAPRAARLDARIETASRLQRDHDSYRGGDIEKREELRKRALRASWQARLDARVVVRAHILNERFEQAADVTERALMLNRDDLALLDMHAEAQGRLGMAEEARGGPLSRLKSETAISLGVRTVTSDAPARDAADRLLMPALTLYRANPEAGRKQFEQIRRTFTRSSRGTPIHPGVVGVWLYLNNERELGREYLLEASGFDGHDSGKPLYSNGIYYEVALLDIGDSKPVEDDDEEADDEIEQPAEDDEVESVEMADVGDAHPLIRKVLRTGGIMGSVHNTREYLQELANVSLYGGSSGFTPVMEAARAYPGGRRTVFEALYRMPAKLAEVVGAAEIERWLKPDSPVSESLSNALESMSESIGQLQNSSSWRLRQTLGQRAGPVFGMVEARAALLRAKLRLDGPQTVEELAAWLKANQELIDVRSHLQKSPDDGYLRMRAARKEAGMPEVVHKGLLLDGAQILARAGHPGAGAGLIWHNRDARLGMESRAHLLALAGVLARKGGDRTLAARCRVEVAVQGSRGSFDMQAEFELPLVRENILEFGDTADVLAFLENAFVPGSTSEQVPVVKHLVPEAKQARPNLFMRNPSDLGIENIFESSITNASCTVIERNWNKLLLSDDTLPTTRRLAAWVIVSDLPLYYHSQGFTGCNSARDTIGGWTMLHALYRRTGEEERAKHMAALLARTDSAIENDLPARYWD